MHSKRLTLNHFVPFCLVAATLGFHCSDNATLAGGSAEQGNAFTVAGKVSSPSGSSLSAMKVVARPSEYVPAQGVFPADTLSALTDAGGRFAIEGLDSGVYTLTAFDSARTVFAIQRGQVVADDDSSFVLTADSSARVMVPVSETDGSVLVFVPGTEIHEEVPPGDTALLTVPGTSLDITVRHQYQGGGYRDTVYREVPVVTEGIVNPTLVPKAPTGPRKGMADSAYIFTAIVPDLDTSSGASGKPVEFRFAFSGQDTTFWQSGARGTTASWSWAGPGVYDVIVQFRFSNYTLPDRTTAVLYSAWSPPLVVTIAE